MAYQVLARKWRPRGFASLVGQEHVQRALINALDHDRLHHAYLFTGTRGVGKTTIARILAKALNCEKGVSSTPCGECSACVEIDEGRFVDLIEVDAASRTKVEDTRDLMDNVQYTPARGRFKVYLIDEVHMLSGHSFNALLKTLEEPPPHVKFLLATTDPQKLPLTVLSRCLQFNLKRLPPDLITTRLAHVLEAEGIEFDTAALKLIARAAEGSMRDALSLVDQAIGFGGGKVVDDTTRAMLGTIDRGKLLAMLQSLADGDGNTLLETARSLLEQASDPLDLLDELASLLQRIAMLQVVPDAAGDDDGDLLGLADRMSPEDAQLAYQIALHGKRDLPLAPEPRAGLEMTLLRMLAFAPVGDQAQRVTPRPRSRQPAHREPAPAAPDADASPDRELTGLDWAATVEDLGLRGASHQLALNCVFRNWDGDALHLELDAAFEQLRTPGAEQRLQEALSKLFRKKVLLRIHAGKPGMETPAQSQGRKAGERRQQARASLERDPDLQALTESFNTTFDPDAVRPVD